MKEKLLKIINNYGVMPQLKYFQSEVFELNEAIINANIFDFIVEEYTDIKGNRPAFIKHIAEEIADVMVMLKQLQYYYEIEDKEIEEVMKQKVDRQLERIEKED